MSHSVEGPQPLAIANNIGCVHFDSLSYSGQNIIYCFTKCFINIKKKEKEVRLHHIDHNPSSETAAIVECLMCKALSYLCFLT